MLYAIKIDKKLPGILITFYLFFFDKIMNNNNYKRNSGLIYESNVSNVFNKKIQKKYVKIMKIIFMIIKNVILTKLKIIFNEFNAFKLYNFNVIL